MTATSRALLALALLAGFHLLTWGLVLGFLALVAVLLGAGLTASSAEVARLAGTLVPLVGGSLPVVVALVHGVLVAGRDGGPRRGSLLVTRREAPGLWATVTALAERIDAPLPDEIRLVGDVNAAVSEDNRLLGLTTRVRRLYVGVPLLVGLEADEFRAVLCHELGHYARGHTRFGAVTYRGSAALAVTRRRAGAAAEANPLVRAYSGLQLALLSGYAWLYDTVSLAVRRRQEFEADAAAASATSPRVVAEALRSAQALAVAWEDFRLGALEPMGERGQYPDDPFRAFETVLADPGQAEALARWRAEPPEPPRSRLDSHPGLDQRLAALAALAEQAGAPVARDRRPPLELLADPARTAARVARHHRPLGATTLPWRQWLGELAAHRAGEPARGLAQATVRLGQPASLEGVLTLLETGRTHRLARALTDARAEPQVPPETGEHLLGAALFGWIGQALVRDGRAEWTLGWSGGSRLVAREVTSAELFDLVHAAVRDPWEVSRLRLRLAEWGLDVAREAERDTHRPGPVAAARIVVGEEDAEERRRVTALGLTGVGVVIAVVVLALLTGREEPFSGPTGPPPGDSHPSLPPTSYPTGSAPLPSDFPPILPTAPALPRPSWPTALSPSHLVPTGLVPTDLAPLPPGVEPLPSGAPNAGAPQGHP